MKTGRGDASPRPQSFLVDALRRCVLIGDTVEYLTHRISPVFFAIVVLAAPRGVVDSVALVVVLGLGPMSSRGRDGPRAQPTLTGALCRGSFGLDFDVGVRATTKRLPTCLLRSLLKEESFVILSILTLFQS